jgi:hypothetical protein
MSDDEEEVFNPHEPHHEFYLQRGAGIAKLIERIDLEVDATKPADEQDAVLMELARELLHVITRTGDDVLMKNGANFPQHEGEEPGTSTKAGVAMALLGGIGMYVDSKVMGDDTSHATRAVNEKAKATCINELMPKIKLVKDYIDVLNAENGLAANNMLGQVFDKKGHGK